MSKALGTDDSINTCDCCGKTGLKFTVAIELDCGEIVHYGQVCASRNTGKTRPQINAEIQTEYQRKRAAAAVELKASPEFQALAAKMEQRPRDLIGKAAKDFVWAEWEAETAKRCEIAARHNLQPYEVTA